MPNPLKIDSIEVETSLKHNNKDVITDGSNVGSGKQICKDKVGNDIRFRSVTGDLDLVVLTQNSDDLNIKVDTTRIAFDQFGDLLIDQFSNIIIV